MEHTTETPSHSSTMSLPRLLLHAEGFAVFMGAILAYGALGGGWGWFAQCLLVPDVSALGFLVNKQVGTLCYNAVHTTLLPLALLGATWAFSLPPVLMLVALIWLAHIGMDRTVGYGLKYVTGFKVTHLQKL